MMKVPSDLDYLIVLGAHVDGTRLTLALLERTRRALQYLKDNPRTRAVLSGGRGTGEQISEAEAMYRYLTSRGIAGERLLLEDQSVNTAENIRFSLEKIGSKDVSIGVVTNNFSCVPRSSHRKEMRMHPDLSGAVPVPFLAASHIRSPGDSGDTERPDRKESVARKAGFC